MAKAYVDGGHSSLSKLSSGMPDDERSMMKGWQVGKYLGSGGFAWVLEGKAAGRVCALKFVHILKRKHARQYERQKTEVQAELDVLRAISHDNVISMYDFGPVVYHTPEGHKAPTYCFAMERCRRFDLFDLIYHSKKFEEPLACHIFKQIAAGVSEMHKLGFAHRDLKSQNVLFSDDFTVKLIDFGSSKHCGAELMHTYKVGTQGHQAPEVILGRDYTKRCDVFSLGVVLFILVTGHPAFREAVITDPRFRPLCKEPTQCDQFWKKHKNDDPSAPFKRLIEKMLAYQPLHRYNIQDVIAHEWLQIKPIDRDSYQNLMKERIAICEAQDAIVKNVRCEKFANMYTAGPIHE